MGTWNYRVIHTTEAQTGRDLYAIHEAYYDGAGKMRTITAEPVEAGGESLEELTHDLIHQLQACTRPVVEYNDVPEPQAERFAAAGQAAIDGLKSGLRAGGIE